MSGAALARPGGRGADASATLAIAFPIAVANLSQMAMAITDSVMLGHISDDALAAGGLGGNLFFTVVITLQGVLSAVGVLVARARGAGDAAAAPVAYWSGMALAAGLALAGFLVASFPAPLLRWSGEPEGLQRDVTAYLGVLRWGAPAALMGTGLMRAFLPAVGLQRVLLWVVPSAVLLNGALNWQLIHGGFGLPGFGLRGSAAATAATLWAVALTMGALLHARPAWRAHVWPPRVRLGVMREVLAIGLPVSGASLMEGALFLATGLLAGSLGAETLAAHAVAINVTAVTFMIPYAISQAANVRVAEASGAGDAGGARRAGTTAVALAAGIMAAAALALVAAPGLIASLFVTGPAAAIAVRLLQVSAMFQLADGVQVVAAGALRGLKDTRVPMLLAALGYWGIGFWSGRWLAFDGGLGAVGLWLGLFAGLMVSAACLTARFLWLTRRIS
jgi:MATE family multidrug resistance protein